MTQQLVSRYKDEWRWRKDDFPILQEVAKKTGSISEFIAEYVLDPMLDTVNKDGGKNDDVVILSTIHSSKGLEARAVYVVNCSVFTYPTERAILNGDANVEEERRCLYVALTRAKDYLYIYRDIHSLHVSNKDGGNRYFFNELPPELYTSEIIAANYLSIDKVDMGKIANEDIYSDFNLE